MTENELETVSLVAKARITVDDVWTSRDVANEVGITQVRVRQLIADGRFPNARKVGRTWIIPSEDVESYLEFPDKRRKRLL